jgi:hypothetical protein
MINYTIETSLHLLEVRIQNAVTILDFVNFLAGVSKDLRYGPLLKSLFIVENNARLINLLPEFVSTFLQRVDTSNGPEVWAFVLPDEAQKAIFLRALQNFVPRRIKIRLFEDEFRALQWLKLN